MFLGSRNRLEESRSAVEYFYNRRYSDEATREAIVRHFNEGHSRRVEGSKSTWQLYGELFTTYRWNLFVGFMLHVIQ